MSGLRIMCGISAVSLCGLGACELSFKSGIGEQTEHVEEIGLPVPGRPWGAQHPLEIAPALSVRNDHPATRTETLRASVPFPQGMVTSLNGLGIAGFPTAWLPLQRWPDGSIRLAQAQFTDTLPGNSLRRYHVNRGQATLQGAFTPHPRAGQLGVDVRIAARVYDTFIVPYEAEVRGTLETLQETPLVRVRRHRDYHRTSNPNGIGRNYLTSTFYITEFRDMPVMIVDWILGNDYLGADNPQGSTDPNLYPLGGIDVIDPQFLFRGVAECRPYLANLHGVPNSVTEPSGWTRYTVMPRTYLDDGQTRRYRFLVRFNDPGASPQVVQHWSGSLQAMAQATLFPLANLHTWQESQALGLYGGPVDPPADALQRAQSEYLSWLNGSDFGTWGSFGDQKNTAQTGTPRNGPASPELFHAVQAEHHRLLTKLEQKAWAQAMRTYHLYGLQVGAEQKILLWDGIPFWPESRDLSHESLGRRGLWAADPYAAYRTTLEPGHRGHGWGWFDHDHWTTDLLFDYWSITGDEWAREELRQLGESLKGLMRLRDYGTRFVQSARSEGWAMQSFVQVYLATRDPNIRAYALRRIHEVVNPGRGTDHPSRALSFQGNYPGTRFGGNSHRFFMPWQHGPVLYGYLAAYRFFRDPICLDIAEDVVTTVDYSWVRNYRDPRFGLVPRGLRYYTPVELNGSLIPANYFDNISGIGVRWSDTPLGGANVFLVGGLHLLADVTQSDYVRGKALYFGSVLGGDLNNPSLRWAKWWASVPARYSR